MLNIMHSEIPERYMSHLVKCSLPVSATFYSLSELLIEFFRNTQEWQYRSGTVNLKSFVGKVLLRIKWKFELTVYFKHEMLEK